VGGVFPEDVGDLKPGDGARGWAASLEVGEAYSKRVECFEGCVQKDMFVLGR